MQSAFPPAPCKQVPTHAWPVLDLFHGELFDREARRALLAIDKGQNMSALGGLRPLVFMSCDTDVSLQQRVASSFLTLLDLAQARICGGAHRCTQRCSTPLSSGIQH